MASLFHVNGPVAIQTDTVLAGTFVTLGYLDNEQLIGWRQQVMNLPLKSSKDGDEQTEVIYTGTMGFLDVLCTNWDKTERDSLLVMPGGSVAGDAGVVGSLWVSGSFIFQVRIAPIDQAGALVTPTASKVRYTFPRCYIDGDDAIRVFDVGVNNTKLALSFTCLRDGSDNLWTQETS